MLLVPRARCRPRTSEAHVDRLVDVRTRSPEQARSVGVVPALFVQAMLPHKPVREGGAERPVHVVRGGAFTLTLRAGYVSDGDGAPRCVGVPYGGLGRVLLAHVCTEALRRRSRAVPLGPSITALAGALSVTASTGHRGRAAYLRDAVLRLATVVVSCEQHGRTARRTDHALAQTLLADGVRLWHDDGPSHAGALAASALASRLRNPSDSPDSDPELLPDGLAERRVMPGGGPAASPEGGGGGDPGDGPGGTLLLSAAFYAHLERHAVPVDLRKLHLLAHRPLALDAYVWCTHRAYGLARTGTRSCAVSTAALHAQFGSGYGSVKEFGRHLRSALGLVRALWPTLSVEVVSGHVVLRTARPDVALAGSTRPPASAR